MIMMKFLNGFHFEFIWITDGKGWNSAKGNLKETFLVLENLYNINDLEEGIFYKIFAGKNLVALKLPSR